MHHLNIKRLVITNKDKTIVNIDEKISLNSSLAIVGQSGSGKSLTLKLLLDMLPKNLTSKIEFESSFKLNCSNIGFVPQNPFTSLSPLTKIRNHFLPYSDEKNIDKLLDLVKLPKEFKNRFTLNLSGGQLQRIVIAIALSNNPKLLLLDEPTTALDEETKFQILDLLKQLQRELGFLMIFVSHDMESVENLCEYTAIMHNGKICEYGKTDRIINHPQNEYTKELISSNFKNREFRV